MDRRAKPSRQPPPRRWRTVLAWGLVGLAAWVLATVPTLLAWHLSSDVQHAGAPGLWLMTAVLAGLVLGGAHRSSRMAARGAVAGLGAIVAANLVLWPVLLRFFYPSLSGEVGDGHLIDLVVPLILGTVFVPVFGWVLLGGRRWWVFLLAALLTVPPWAGAMWLVSPPPGAADLVVVAWSVVLPALAMGSAVGLGTGVHHALLEESAGAPPHPSTRGRAPEPAPRPAAP
ncbi:MAG TPA: hypothetical protein VLO09_01920 [Ornithinimicrobium sp.]|nr:hypothetical protein [Ornithinimicrobium sp.]